MKRFAVIILFVCFLVGCAAGEESGNVAIKLRNSLYSSNGCSFEGKITADYGDAYNTFTMGCVFDNNSDMKFCVKDPATIAGISGTVSNDGGFLEFDDEVLLFPLLLEDQLTPVCTPWLFYNTLLGGVIKGAGEEGNQYQVIYTDVFSGEAFDMYVWFGEDLRPISCEFVWQGRRILSMDVSNFVIM